MDATAYLALAAALDRELPTALESMAEARERAAMFAEDVSMHAITGRVVANESQSPARGARFWQLWRRYAQVQSSESDKVGSWGARALEAMRRIATANREALGQAMTAVQIMTAGARMTHPDVDYDYYDMANGGRLVRIEDGESGEDSEGGEDGEGSDASM